MITDIEIVQNTACAQKVYFFTFWKTKWLYCEVCFKMHQKKILFKFSVHSLKWKIWHTFFVSSWIKKYWNPLYLIHIPIAYEVQNLFWMFKIMCRVTPLALNKDYCKMIKA